MSDRPAWLDVSQSEVRCFKVYDPARVLEATAAMQAAHPSVVEVIVGGGHEHGGERGHGPEPFTLILLLGLNATDAAL